MSKRAERRHHEERVKGKFRKVAERMAGDVWSWMYRWRFKIVDGKRITVKAIDNSGGAKRMQYIEKTASRMSHHPQHQCSICHPDEKQLKRERQFEIEKKAPLITEE